MKKNIIFNGVAGFLGLGIVACGLTSCKDDYLSLEPITDTSTAVLSNMVGARAAMVGLCNGMYRYADDYTFGVDGQNGESWALGFYAEGMGNSNIQGNWNYGDWYVDNLVNWFAMGQASGNYASYMWRYCYNLIDDANNILANIDNVEASEDEQDEKDYIKAVALTIRSHAYIHLLQTYGPRWADSNEGNTYCVVLRLEPSTTENIDKDFSTMAQVLKQIYDDLDEAIDLFDGSSYNRGNNIWMPNIEVAQGLYARAALLKNDYPTALEMATDAMANHPIMSADEYRSGFAYANDEYIWASALENLDLGWNTFGSFCSFNGYYISGWGIGNSMDYTLYKNIPMTDCRKLLYFMPELMDLIPDLNSFYGITPESFFISMYDEDYGIADPTNYTIYLDGNDDEAFYLLDDYAWGYYADYGYESALAYYPDNLGMNWGFATPRFGMAMKYWGVGDYCYNQFPYMRASEMGYIVAECQYQMQNEQEARDMMNYLNQDVRDPYYNCTATGEDLLTEIKVYREIELWDEGHNWFDLKRWGDPCVRNIWVEGDENSGNWGSLAKSMQPDAMGGWRWVVPEVEFTYNKAADLAKVRY